MAPRHELHVELKAKTPNVYFQPPASVQMTYPCIVYKRDAEEVKAADNAVYNERTRYLLTVMDYDPDGLRALVKTIPGCRFVRHYSADNLNHDIFSLTF